MIREHNIHSIKLQNQALKQYSPSEMMRQIAKYVANKCKPGERLDQFGKLPFNFLYHIEGFNLIKKRIFYAKFGKFQQTQWLFQLHAFDNLQVRTTPKVIQLLNQCYCDLLKYSTRSLTKQSSMKSIMHQLTSNTTPIPSTTNINPHARLQRLIAIASDFISD